MKYENMKKLEKLFWEIFFQENKELVEKCNKLHIECMSNKESIRKLEKENKTLDFHKRWYKNAEILINKLVEDWVIKDISWDVGGMTEYWPVWDWWQSYKYKETEYNINWWSL